MEEETELLRWYKGRHVGEAAASVRLAAWDRLFYTARARVPFKLPHLPACSMYAAAVPGTTFKA